MLDPPLSPVPDENTGGFGAFSGSCRGWLEYGDVFLLAVDYMADLRFAVSGRTMDLPIGSGTDCSQSGDDQIGCGTAAGYDLSVFLRFFDLLYAAGNLTESIPGLGIGRDIFFLIHADPF